MAKPHGDLITCALHPLPWILIVLTLPSSIHGIRKDIGLPGKLLCRNTVQGRYLLSDDNGYICSALTVDRWSRCCPEAGNRFSCQGCNLVSQCCNSYEYCVSCCLNPSRTQKDLALKVKIGKPVTAGTYASVFDFCAGRCRHNSASVVSCCSCISLNFFNQCSFHPPAQLLFASYGFMMANNALFCSNDAITMDECIGDACITHSSEGTGKLSWMHPYLAFFFIARASEHGWAHQGDTSVSVKEQKKTFTHP